MRNKGKFANFNTFFCENDAIYKVIVQEPVRK